MVPGMHALPPEAIETLRHFEQAVLASPHNLVSRRARVELWDRHISEAVGLAGLLPGPATLLDVGSGGGLPGFVVAIARPDLRVTLLDASQKKTTFLAETASDLDVGLSVIRGRAEDLRVEMSGSFDLVTARAVAPLVKLLGWTLPFLAPGGLLYAIKGDRWEAELRAATPELRRWDGQLVATPKDMTNEGDLKVIVVRRVGGRP